MNRDATRPLVAALTATLTTALLLILSTVVIPGIAAAHEPKPVIKKVRLLDEQSLQATVDVHLESLLLELMPATHSNSANTIDHVPAAGMSGATPALATNFESMYPDELTAAFKAVQEPFLQAIAPLASGSFGTLVLKPVFVELNIPATAGLNNERRSTISITANIPPGTRTLQWRRPEQSGELHLRVESASGGKLLATIVTADKSSPELDLRNFSGQSIRAVFLDYLKSGFRHILPLGLDHLLFIIGLVILSRRWQDLVKQITVFTLAHSVTLVLGSVGIVTLSATLVEPLIALSIIFIAAENLWTTTVRSGRLIVIFIFGLLHGLGFALVLGDVGLSAGVFVSALLGFNIGVELGQLTVAALCVGLIWLGFGRPGSPRSQDRAAPALYRKLVVVPVSLSIGLVGLYWLLQRLGILAGG